MNYIDEDTYLNLLGILELDFPELANSFKDYFDEAEYDGEIVYICSNVSGYTNWLSQNLFDGGEVDEDWIAWSGIISGLSGQGSDPL